MRDIHVLYTWESKDTHDYHGKTYVQREKSLTTKTLRWPGKRKLEKKNNWQNLPPFDIPRRFVAQRGSWRTLAEKLNAPQKKKTPVWIRSWIEIFRQPPNSWKFGQSKVIQPKKKLPPWRMTWSLHINQLIYIYIPLLSIRCPYKYKFIYIRTYICICSYTYTYIFLIYIYIFVLICMLLCIFFAGASDGLQCMWPNICWRDGQKRSMNAERSLLNVYNSIQQLISYTYRTHPSVDWRLSN